MKNKKCRFQIGKMAIIYKLSIEVNREKYIIIGHTFDLLETQDRILNDLKEGSYDNIKFQEKYNELIKQDIDILGLYITFETLQALRPAYYPSNVLPMLMEQLEKSYIKTIYEDYKIRGKEYLILNDIG